MTNIEITHFHIFAGLGGGAKGFNRGEARVGNLEARFTCLGGIDVDAAACRDFERLAGELAQELGGVGLTLLALAHAVGISADEAEQRELARVMAKPLEHFAARNQTKNDAGFLAAEISK